MTQHPEPHDEAVNRLFDEHQRALTDGLDRFLDVEAGLREVLLQSHHDTAVDALENVLDVEAGLAAILPTTSPPSSTSQPDSTEIPESDQAARELPQTFGSDRSGEPVNRHRSQAYGFSETGKGLNKGIRKVEVALKWDPSPAGQPHAAVNLVAAVYSTSDPYGDPAHLVRFDSRSPDGTIVLYRNSELGMGFGWDEVMTLELDRFDGRYARVVVGVVMQQGSPHQTFAGVLNPALRIREGYTILAEDDFGGVLGSTAATVAEFSRDEYGQWDFRPGMHGFNGDTATFTATMGRTHER